MREEASSESHNKLEYLKDHILNFELSLDILKENNKSIKGLQSEPNIHQKLRERKISYVPVCSLLTHCSIETLMLSIVKYIVSILLCL